MKRKSSLVSSVRQIKLRSSLLINRHPPLPGKGEETPLQREMCAPFFEKSRTESSIQSLSQGGLFGGGTCCSPSTAALRS